jgi:hypothetical protein
VRAKLIERNRAQRWIVVFDTGDDDVALDDGEPIDTGSRRSREEGGP